MKLGCQRSIWGSTIQGKYDLCIETEIHVASTLCVTKIFMIAVD